MGLLRLLLSLLLSIIIIPEVGAQSPESTALFPAKGILVLLLEEAETSERYEIIGRVASKNEPVPGDLFEWLLNLEPPHLKEQLTAELMAGRLESSYAAFEEMIRLNDYYYARFARDFHTLRDNRLRALLVIGAVYSSRPAYFLGLFLAEWRQLADEGKTYEVSVREMNALAEAGRLLSPEVRRNVRASAALLYLDIEGNHRTAALRRFLEL